jgi:tRNA (cmo5U34)-methyltransferase
MVPILEEMSDFFNSRADDYNVVHVGHLDGGIESKNIIASFLPDHTKTIIDFGIGTGLELAEIFKRFPDVEVTGVDVAENMLQQLRESYPDKNIRLHCSSYFDFDFGKSCYDAAISVMTLHHYDHKTKTDLYRKIHNCIKENGIYIEGDYMLSEKVYENAQEKEGFYFSEYARLKEEQGIADNREYHYDTPCTVENQMKMLVNAGFSNVREVWQNGNSVILIADK